MVVAIAIVFGLLGIVRGADVGVEQVHLSLTGDLTTMGVDWVTPMTAPASVQYGLSPDKLDMSATGGTGYFNETGHMHWAEMTGLQAGTTYFYGLSGQASPIRNFTTLDVAKAQPRFAVMADWGLIDGEYTFSKLEELAEANAFDVGLVSGDLAYDLDTNKSQTGNMYMNKNIEPIFSHRPLVATVGNHERGSYAGSLNFTNFERRFNASRNTLGKRSNTDSSFYFSLDVGLTHLLFFSSEIWTYFQDKGEQESMLNFIKQDIASVDRTKTPWVIAFGHKYFGMETNWTLLEPALTGVDLYYFGHVHAYQRFPSAQFNKMHVDWGCLSADNYTYTNCDSMIGVEIGDAGNHEGNAVSTLGLPRYMTIKNTTQYGFATFQAQNATHLTSEFIHSACYPASSTCTPFKDHFTIIKS